MIKVRDWSLDPVKKSVSYPVYLIDGNLWTYGPQVFYCEESISLYYAKNYHAIDEMLVSKGYEEDSRRMAHRIFDYIHAMLTAHDYNKEDAKFVMNFEQHKKDNKRRFHFEPFTQNENAYHGEIRRKNDVINTKDIYINKNTKEMLMSYADINLIYDVSIHKLIPYE